MIFIENFFIFMFFIFLWLLYTLCNLNYALISAIIYINIVAGGSQRSMMITIYEKNSI